MSNSSIETIHDKLWSKLTRGVTDKLDVDGAVIDKWSPNNLRRIIVSPEGVVFQPFITKGTFFNSKIGVVEFPVSEETQKDLNKRALLSVLYKDRVFSSIEEIIIIPNSPNVPYGLSPRELQMHKITSFKRLSNLIIVDQPVSLKDFTAMHVEHFTNKYKQLSESNTDIIRASKIVQINKDWYNHTSLRPQFYTLDEEDKELSKYFREVKEYYSNLNKQSIVTRQKGNQEEKGAKIKEDPKKSFSKQAKTLVMYRLVQASIAKNPKISENRLLWFQKHSPVEIRQLKKEYCFKDGVDEDFNNALKRLGMYHEDAETDNERLEDTAGKLIAISTKDFISEIRKNYSMFGEALQKEFKQYLTKPYEPSNLRVLSMLDYRKPFESDKVLSNTEVSLEQRRLLIEGLQGHAIKCVDIAQGILFDLGYSWEDIEFVFEGSSVAGVTDEKEGNIVDITSKVKGLDVVLLHDLFVYCNNVEHRMYNSLFGKMGYVTDQPVGERIRLLVKEIANEEWEESRKIATNLTHREYKNAFANTKDDIIRCLGFLSLVEDGDEEKKKTGVARTVVEIIETLNSSDPRRLAFTFAMGKLKEKPNLGGKGDLFSTHDVVRKVLDFDKPINSDYSQYLKLIENIVLK